MAVTLNFKKKKIMLVKLGGSLITDKAGVSDFKPAVIRRLGQEIKKALTKFPNLAIILSHGQGSFAHIPAKKYGTVSGFIDDRGQPTLRRGRLGACVTADAAAEINRIVIKELLKIGLPVTSIAPSSIFVSADGELKKGYFDSIEILINNGIIPVLYGDVIWDRKKGCCIFSGETSLGIVAEYLLKNKYKVERIIQCGIEDGVYEWENKKVIKKITPVNFNILKKEIRGAAGVDVTGGMLHKVEESLKIAKKGVETLIVNGNQKNILYNCLMGKKVKGTVITLR